MGATHTPLQAQLNGQPGPRAANGLHSVTSSAHQPHCPHWTVIHSTQGWVGEQRPPTLVIHNGLLFEGEGNAEVPPVLQPSVESPCLWLAGGGENASQPVAAFATLQLHMCYSPAAEHPCLSSQLPREQAGEYLLIGIGAAAYSHQQPGSKLKDVCQIF